MVAEIARDAETRGLPISGIGGVTTWRDAAEFLALGAGNVQVCTAAMTYGFKIVQGNDLRACRTGWTKRAMPRSPTCRGMAVPNVTDWQYLNLNYVTKARIDQDACIKCGRCYAACEDTSHQAISMSDGPGVRGDRRRMRRLQPVRQCLPGRGLHHDGGVGAGRRWIRAPARWSRRTMPTGRRIPTIRRAPRRRSSLDRKTGRVVSECHLLVGLCFGIVRWTSVLCRFRRFSGCGGGSDGLVGLGPAARGLKLGDYSLQVFVQLQHVDLERGRRAGQLRIGGALNARRTGWVVLAGVGMCGLWPSGLRPPR